MAELISNHHMPTADYNIILVLLQLWEVVYCHRLVYL